MDIQPKLDHIAALIDKLPDGKQHENHSLLSKEFFTLSEDASLPRTLRDFCLHLSQLTGGNAGPLGNISKKRIKEVFLSMKVLPN